MNVIIMIGKILTGTINFMFGTWYMIIISLYIMLEIINVYQGRGLMIVRSYKTAKELYGNFVNFPWNDYAEVIKRGKKE